MGRFLATSTSLLLLGLQQQFSLVLPCTDILVTPGASTDGSAMIAYNADSAQLFGSIYEYPATHNNPLTATRKVYDWDSGVYLGEIAEAPSTYRVVGNTNEFGLVIGESTFGGVEALAGTQTDGKVDYGSLIYITLQRAKTCDEAISVMATLMDTYGYYSAGESFSLADPTGAVWMMEVIGTGPSYRRKGAVWVAQRIPDGAVAAHANQARITTFARDDPDNFRFADDVVEVAVHYGLYDVDADPLDFSFSDVYDPLDFISARQGEARVWSIFSQIADTTQEFQNSYQPYAMGLALATRMPLYITPVQKLSVTAVMKLMSSHYEGTVMDSTLDVGSGLFAAPYRPRPLEWTFNDTLYHNERSVATPKTGWSFVAQVRPWMPLELATLFWFAADDSSTAPRTPVYAASLSIPEPYRGPGSQDGMPQPLLRLDVRRAFWVQNMVSNFVYYRWSDAYPMLQDKLAVLHQSLIDRVAAVDSKAVQLYNKVGPRAARDAITRFTVQTGRFVHDEWWDFYGELFVRFRDMYTIVADPEEKSCNCRAMQPGLSQVMKERIVDETGDHYAVPPDSDVHPDVVATSSTKTVNGEDELAMAQWLAMQRAGGRKTEGSEPMEDM